MRIRYIATALAAFALAFSSAASSQAADAIPGQDPTAEASIISAQAGDKVEAAERWCKFTAQRPFFLVSSGPLYAEGKYTGCSSPLPDSCHPTVELMKVGPYGAYAVAQHDAGWQSCNKRVTAPKYNCLGRDETTRFYTLVTLGITWHGGQASDAGASEELTARCY